MRTLGIDLAAQKKTTAACLLDWQHKAARVESLEVGVDDDRLLQLADAADKIAIDVPFGWPDAFVEAVTAHRDRRPWPKNETISLRFRRTDLHVWEQTGRWPLSVSTDKLGVPAFRAARLLSAWAADRSGRGKYVEVYPRAARRCFDLAEERSLSELRERAPWLCVDELAEAQLARSEDCFDALIASLVARARMLNLCLPIPAQDQDAAEREGWIALPLPQSLGRLAD